MPRNKVRVQFCLGFALCYFYSKVKMVAKKEETSPDGASFCFLNQAIQYCQEFLALKSGGGLEKRCVCPCSGVKACSKVPAF